MHNLLSCSSYFKNFALFPANCKQCWNLRLKEKPQSTWNPPSSWISPAPNWFWYSDDSIFRMYGTTESIWTFPIRPAKKSSSRTSGWIDLRGDRLKRRRENLASDFSSPDLPQYCRSSFTALSWYTPTCLLETMPVWSINNELNEYGHECHVAPAGPEYR